MQLREGFHGFECNGTFSQSGSANNGDYFQFLNYLESHPWNMATLSIEMMEITSVKVYSQALVFW